MLNTSAILKTHHPLSPRPAHLSPGLQHSPCAASFPSCVSQRPGCQLWCLLTGFALANPFPRSCSPASASRMGNMGSALPLTIVIMLLWNLLWFTADVSHSQLSSLPQASLGVSLWIFVSTADVLSTVPSPHSLAGSFQAMVLTWFWGTSVVSYCFLSTYSVLLGNHICLKLSSET